MKLVEIKCKNCGSKLKIKKDTFIVHCDYCNTDYSIEDNSSDVEKGYNFEKGRDKYYQEKMLIEQKKFSETEKEKEKINKKRINNSDNYKIYKYVIVSAILVLFIALMAIFNEKEDKLINYVPETIIDALQNEGISYNESAYVNNNNDNSVKVYLFRGHGCSHCYEFLEFVNDELIKKYKNKITFEIYETWNNADNNALMKKVSKFLGDNATGVPYIIIGNKTWIGYAEEFADEIKAKIDEEYAKDASERYDVILEMNKAI